MMGVEIKKIRKKKSINQIDMAEMLGMAQGTLSKIERNKLQPNMQQLAKLRSNFRFNFNKYLDNTAK